MAINDDIPRTAVNQAPYGGTDYPFTGPSVLNGYVLDLYVSYEDDACAHPMPFSAEVAGETLYVYDAENAVVATGVLALATTRAWGTRTVYQWTDDAWVLRAVLRDDLAAEGTGALDPRTCHRVPPRVRSFRVGLVQVTGNVRFEAGYNIDLSGADADAPLDGGRYVTQVAMDAVAGAGLGRLQGCDDVTPLVRRINRTTPDCGGNFNVEVDPCFRAQLPLFVTGEKSEARSAEYSAAGLSSEEAAHALRLTSDCRPCCDCDHFVRTYRGLKRMWDRWKGVANAAEAVRDLYESNRARWLSSRNCRISNPARLFATADYNCQVQVGGSFCNLTTCCLVPVELRFTIQLFKAGVLQPWTAGTGSVAIAYLTGSPTNGEERYVPLQTGPIVRFLLDYADPQAMSVAKFKFCVSSCEPDQSLKITLTAHIPDQPPNLYTGAVCEMATDVAVDPDVSDLWAANGVPDTGVVRATLTKSAALNPAQPVFACGC